MKYILVIGDGMADAPIAALDGKTPLEYLRLPQFDRISHTLGMAQTVPAGVAPGSDTAIMTIFGCANEKYYSGRAPLEAAALYKKDDTAYLCWTCNPEVTYVLEYTPSKLSDTEIIKMANSAKPIAE